MNLKGVLRIFDLLSLFMHECRTKGGYVYFCKVRFATLAKDLVLAISCHCCMKESREENTLASKSK